MAKLDDLAAQCIKCGFCLESCPTFLITGDESQSPRGRITLSREANRLGRWDQATHEALESCLGCRACETACPSGVQYGKILELAREATTKEHGRAIRKPFLNALTQPNLARLQFGLAGLLPGGRPPAILSQLLSGELPQADAPRLPSPAPWPALEEHDLPPVKGEVYMLEGCVMRVLYPDVNEATERLLRRIGYRVRKVNAGCCGAMHAHSGYLAEAESRAQSLAQAMPDDLPIIINSAGCGSTIREYGGVIGVGLEGFAARAKEVSTFLLEHGLADALRHSPGLPGMVATYHDACHLLHGQKVKDPPRALLGAIPGLSLVPLPESDLCCGSAGTYNIFQPTKARTLLERKWANVESTGAGVVVTGNPGCQAWIAQAAREHGQVVEVRHTLDVLEASFSGWRVGGE